MNIKHFAPILILALVATQSCKIDQLSDPNNPDSENIINNASLSEIQNLVTGMESEMRDVIDIYLDGMGVIGRDFYRFSGSDPRYTSDLLGKAGNVLDNNAFYTTNPFAARYQVIKNANIMEAAITNTSESLTVDEKAACIGYAKTIKAYELMMVLNQQWDNGIRSDVANPDNLGPFLSLTESLTAIRTLLDQSYTSLINGVSEFPFTLSSGFDGFDTPANFAKFNRAIAARVALYQGDYTGALTALDDSFYSMNASLSEGVYYSFSAVGGDRLNNMYFPLNANGEVRVVHPSFVADMEPGDSRMSKATMRIAPLTQDGLTSDYDFSVYQSNTDPISMIRNEELILIFAEASARLQANAATVSAIDLIRVSNGLMPYTGGLTEAELMDEIVNQRRYSLYGEGHRLVDMRRLGRLNELPIDRVDDDVFSSFPRPVVEL